MSFANLPHITTSPPHHRMRRRGSSTAYLANEAPASPSSTFSSADTFQCPVCKTTMRSMSASVFEDHVDHCTIRRTISSSLMRRRSSTTSVISDSGFSDDASSSESTNHNARFLPTTIPHPSVPTPLLPSDLEDARFTLSGTGAAVEFGGFGMRDPYDSDDVDLYIPSRPRPVPRRITRPLTRTNLRRRLAVDLHAEAFGSDTKS